MAKGQAGLDNIFKKTEKSEKPEESTVAPTSGVPSTGRTVSVGVGLKESEVTMLDEIADKLDVSRNAIMRYGIRYFLSQIQTGKLNISKDVEEPETKKRLKMP